MSSDEDDSAEENTRSLHPVELTDLSSAVARQAVTIYQEAFPKEERDPLDTIAAALRHRVKPTEIMHWWAFVEGGQVVGIALFNSYRHERMGYLQYIAVRRGIRGHGYGGQFLAMILDQLQEDARKFNGQPSLGLCLEVERPDRAPTLEERSMRLARIRFYLRNGAHAVPRMDFLTPPLAPGQRPVPYHLMFLPIPGASWSPSPARLIHMVEAALLHGYGLRRSNFYFQRALNQVRLLAAAG